MLFGTVHVSCSVFVVVFFSFLGCLFLLLCACVCLRVGGTYVCVRVGVCGDTERGRTNERTNFLLTRVKE